MPRTFPARLARTLLGCVLGLLSAACAMPGGPPLPEIADQINATLEPVETVETTGGMGSTEIPSRNIHVLGEVLHPGPIELESGRRMTLIEAIARVGGHNTATAHTSSLLLVRWDRKKNQQLAWTIDARPQYWGAPKTIFLQPYDVVYIPNMPIDDLGFWVDNYIRRMIPLPIVPLSIAP